METSLQSTCWAWRQRCSYADRYFGGVSDLHTRKTFEHFRFFYGMKRAIKSAWGQALPSHSAAPGSETGT